MASARYQPDPPRLWAGGREPIFGALPGSILANFKNPRSENALLWNLLYPRAQPTLSLRSLIDLAPLWGTTEQGKDMDQLLVPYYWGYDVQGTRLEGLDEVLSEIDGAGPQTEIDLFLLGEHYMIAVEAKHTSLLGRCGRYSAQRCPEVHGDQDDESACRYWEEGPALFRHRLEFGDRPDPESTNIPCNKHYQLARTYLVGSTLAQRVGRDFALWLFLPRKRWRALEKSWLDFSERVLADAHWRAMRVISWEQLQRLPIR